jgi:hypothetical protein
MGARSETVVALVELLRERRRLRSILTVQRPLLFIVGRKYRREESSHF